MFFLCKWSYAGCFVLADCKKQVLFTTFIVLYCICNASTIEDETHFLISCNFYTDIRYDLSKNAVEMKSNFSAMADSEKLIFLMKTDVLQYKLASTLVQMNRRRRSTALI